MCIRQCLICISGYGKTVSHVVIGLKTAKGTKQLKVNIVLNHSTWHVLFSTCILINPHICTLNLFHRNSSIFLLIIIIIIMTCRGLEISVFQVYCIMLLCFFILCCLTTLSIIFCWLQLDPSIYESLQKEKVEVGDVIYIEANSGAVKVWSMFLDTCIVTGFIYNVFVIYSMVNTLLVCY